MDSAGVLTQTITTAVDQLVACDLDTLDDATLHDAVVTIMRERDRLAVAHARLLARWDTRRVWQNDRSRSAAARLTRDTRCATRTARSELHRARRLTIMPATARAGTQGELSLDQVDTLTRANQPWRHDHMERDERSLVASARTLSASDTRRMTDYWAQRVDADIGHDTGEPDTTNHLHVSETLDHTVAITGQLDALNGAAFTNELRHLTEQVRLTDLRNGTHRTPAQRRAAALIEMAIRSASSPPDARRPRPLITVQLGDDTFRHLCELANGTVIAPTALVPWLTNADLETILFDGPTTVLSVSHRRTFTGALRRAIEVRDRHCQHPSGCDTPADQCDVDHIVPHAQGGTTDQFNGRLQCPTHNRRHEFHDHHAQPLPRRDVHPIDTLRARIRWRIRHKIHDETATRSQE